MRITPALLIAGSTFLWLSQAVCAMPSSPRAFEDNQLLPPATEKCQLSVSTPFVDYGNKSRWQLQDVEGNNQLLTPGKRQLSYSVVCTFSQVMRITVQGDSTTGGNFRYGANDKLRVTLSNPQLDGNDVQIMTSTPDGVLIDGPFNTLTLQAGQSFTLVKGHQPVEGKSFSARLELEPVLTERSARVASKQISEANFSLQLR
ncbi:DUF1120 domain-containing protein [Dryocola clanedunensis]|uniref:fimbrial protein n=1 Tax=Cedecea sulfonylureivorans TaxID=3051154 RepID=UPI0019284045|nr:fimbrial protein [Cedecea sulfonylureivorans]